MVSPSWDAGHREHEGAGRPPKDSGLRARARYMAALATFPDALGGGSGGGRGMVGVDIRGALAEAVAWDDGKLRRLGRVDMRRELLAAFAAKLLKEDGVVVEATGNAATVAAVIAPHVRKVVIANPKQVRVIA